MEEEYNFFQNKNCSFYPFEDNENACHPSSNPDTHNCLFCFCPLYFLPPEECPKEANPKVTDNGTKDCSECLFPHKQENYGKLIGILQDELG